MIPKLPRSADLWLAGYLRGRLRRRPTAVGLTHILFAITDHYEPDNGNPGAAVALQRVQRWRKELPVLGAGLRDADGRPPQYTFFYPAETYDPVHLDILAEFAALGLGEVEVHLHHDNDSPENLRAVLCHFRDTLAERHGLLSRDPQGQVRYGFIHGNWALDNSRSDGRHCGVNNELDILRETGCYADFTMPAAPDRCQSRKVNAIYYAADDPAKPRSHDSGIDVRVGMPTPAGELLMIQGPLGIAWDPRRRLPPALENGEIDSSIGHHPTLARFARWLRAGVSVIGREDWVVVKIHTHGAPERNANVLLGTLMRQFHEEILAAFNDGERYQLHYLTARELVNVVLAAQSGAGGNPGAYRDFLYTKVSSSRSVMGG